MDVGESVSFSYTGATQEYSVETSGLYKMEVWGGSGGANGGYSCGYKKLKKDETIYICVGGKGSTSGAYNGGTIGRTLVYPDGFIVTASACGGGATHIATMDGTLATIGESNLDKILIVAGGGGGNNYNTGESGGSFSGGSGGGTSGGSGYNTSRTASGGSQTGGYAFGKGQSGGSYSAGGGGGLYGGYSFGASEECGSGGGGSGYIGGVPSVTAKGTTYSPSTSNGSNSGNGTAKITFVTKLFPSVTFDGTEIDGITFNGTEVDEITFNGTPLD